MKLRYPHPTTVGTSSTTDYEQFTYNAVGSLTSHRKRSGETITLAYDNLHRLTSRSYPTAADNVAFAYDLLGRRTQAKYADNSHTINYVWDGSPTPRPVARGFAYHYDSAANAIGLTCFIFRFLRRPQLHPMAVTPERQGARAQRGLSLPAGRARGLAHRQEREQVDMAQVRHCSQ